MLAEWSRSRRCCEFEAAAGLRLPDLAGRRIMRGMSSVPVDSASVRDSRAPVRSLREPHLFRFGLKHLFLLASACTVFCALVTTTGGPWPWVIAFFSALIVAHVAGNSLGTRLRDTSAEVQRWRAGLLPPGADDPAATPEPVKWAEL